LIFKYLVLLIISVSCFGQQKISDVPASDAAYPAIQRTVDKGHFTLVEGSKFLPNQSVTRKELALLLDRMDELNEKATLTSTEILELKNFSKQFRSYLEDQQNSKGMVDSEVMQIRKEQKTINYDISRVEEHVQEVEKTRKEQEIYIWAALGLGVLSLFSN
tara:strand:+ start:167 stop:649 length:483 start_codon:yes stop_codon:yes gene_type:complete